MKKTFYCLLFVFVLLFFSCSAETNRVDKAPESMRGKVWSGTVEYYYNGISSGPVEVTTACPESGELDIEYLPENAEYSAIANGNTYTVNAKYPDVINNVKVDVYVEMVLRLVDSSTLSVSLNETIKNQDGSITVRGSGILYSK